MEHPSIIVDNFLGKSYSDRILDLTTGPQGFPWSLVKDVTYPGEPSKLDDLRLGFSNSPLRDGMASEFFPLFLPMLDSIQDLVKTECDFIRLRFALHLKDNSDRLYNTPHVDMYENHYTALYYVNDSDGDTYLFNQYDRPIPGSSFIERQHKIKVQNYTVNQKITPKQNKLLVFDGHQLHASSHPKESPFRVVLNINFTTKDPIF